MRIFGLIGYPLSHSFSQKYFSEKFAREGLKDCQYRNFPIPQIQQIREIIDSEPGLVGLNVTIPYKEQVLPFLHDRHPVVTKTGACNCIYLEKGRLSGFNTDTIGFEKSLRIQLHTGDRHALILGSGGASKSVQYVLEQLGIEFLVVSRRKQADRANYISYEQIDRAMVDRSTLLVNTTPVGMYPDIEKLPPFPYEWLTSRHFLYDMIYNPTQTGFLNQGATRGARIQNGLAMLQIQADESWAIWNR